MTETQPMQAEPKRSVIAQSKLLTSACFDTGVKLLSSLARTEKGNVVISPSSVFFVLALLTNGAHGETRDGLIKATGLEDMSLEFLNKEIRRKLNLLNSDKNSVLKIANAVFTSRAVPLIDSFRELAADSYHAHTQEIDFSSESDLNAVDAWVKEKTCGEIETISDCFTPAITMALINALHFMDRWAEPFDPENTKTKKFHLESGQTKMVSMMHTNQSLAYSIHEQCSILWLSYQSEKASMALVLPRPGLSAEQLLSELSYESWKEISSNSQKGQVDLELPKLDLDSVRDLSEALNEMGMKEAFSPSRADFSELCDRPGVHLSKVIQKLKLKIDEEGTVVAAVTATVMEGSWQAVQRPVEFKFNRPFLFFLSVGDMVATGIIRDP